MNRSKTALLVSILSFLFIFSQFTPTAHAAMGKGPIQKLARGFVHLIASPFQLPKEVIQTTGEAETVWLAPWKGMSEGIGKGLYQMGRQVLSGFADIFTFWTPAGRDWDPVFEPASLFPEV